MRDGRDTKGFGSYARVKNGGYGSTDPDQLHSPDAALHHPSHNLPTMTCQYSGGCSTKLVWTKVQRIMQKIATPDDYHCSLHKPSLKNRQKEKTTLPIRNWQK